jgi:mono/diheme cytochrome c family protein
MGAVVGIAILATVLDFSGSVQLQAEGEKPRSGVRQLLEKYCFACHGPKVQKAKLDLSVHRDEEALGRNQGVWLEVISQVRSSAMPPGKAPQPTEAERRKLVAWLDSAMDRIDARLPRNPGRVPIHRLNRTEYNNTIRDLIGLDLRPADAFSFPADDIAHGFDNVADVLSLSPLLLEKYLDAAEKVLDRAIVTSGPVKLLEKKLEGAGLDGARKNGTAAELRLESEIGITLDVAAADDYQVRVGARQTGAGDEPATLVLKINGVDSRVWYLSPMSDEAVVLQAAVPLRAGTQRLALRHTWHTATVPKDKKLPDVKVFVESVEISGPLKSVAHRRIFFIDPPHPVPLPPGGRVAEGERQAAVKIVERFAGRAFRRPVENAELERLLGLYDRGRTSGKSHVESVRLALVAVLIAPQFLFRIETDRGQPDNDGVYRLNDWELASRLSYFLWSSMPDDELFGLARQKRLQDPPVLRQQVKRMLADPKAKALAENFAGQWLGLRKLEGFTPDRTLFPSFTESLRRAVLAEPLLFFETVMREDRSIQEFIDGDWTIVNEELARHYGLKGITGGHFRRVTHTDRHRGGILTMPAVLMLTSHPTRTSAVKRGKWLLEEVLGAPPPPPPPNVPELEEPPRGQPAATTLRERLERHRSDPRCFGCHVRMDALGLGMENFDAVGRWREKEGAKRIDASGTLPGGESFAGPAELKKLLAGRKEDFARTLAEKMFVYALGRGLERFDRREVKAVVDALAKNEWRFSTLVTQIVESYPFRYRQTAEAVEKKP